MRFGGLTRGQRGEVPGARRAEARPGEEAWRSRGVVFVDTTGRSLLAGGFCGCDVAGLVSLGAAEGVCVLVIVLAPAFCVQADQNCKRQQGQYCNASTLFCSLYSSPVRMFTVHLRRPYLLTIMHV